MFYWCVLSFHRLTVLATAKFISFLFLLKNEDAYFRERRRIFQRTKTHKNEDAKKTKKTQKNANAEKRGRIKTKTQKNATLLGHYTESLKIINSSFIIENIFTAFGNKYTTYYLYFWWTIVSYYKIMMKMKCTWLLHPLTWERKKKRQKKKKNENAKKKNEDTKQRRRIFSRTKTYFEERRRKKIKTKTKTQILGERCQLSSGEYCRCELRDSLNCS